MSEQRIKPIHGWLALVLIAAAIFTGSFAKMSRDIGANISVVDIQRSRVLGAETIQAARASITVYGSAGIILANTSLLQSDDTVLSLLTRAAEQANVKLETSTFEFGTLVDQIGNDVSGTGGKYWLYAVNAKDAAVGVDQYPLTGGESITFRFATQ